ncbi:ferritin-like domain-containing protein [Roseococcus sp. SYP-B2431]|uniref:YciE/YciF ferroxidase family protein n=1 Tax=Roseococcus sp. SYP-B2431 TaxID=2496640 RepID=UPI0013F3FE38|nr:ferritin-like domain-containing protein [Roseococcus sp. SYP-B2431]
MTSLDDLFLALLREITFAERQFEKVLPRMALAARNTDLRDAFGRQRDDASRRLARLGEVFRLIGRRVRAETSDTILGLLQDCDELLEAGSKPGAVHDARLVAFGQAAAHHQMSCYGTLLAWAEAMERQEIAALLRKSLEEGRAADRTLARLAALTVNREARAAA